MMIKKHIPNLLTLGNLFCGTLATVFAVEGKFTEVALFVVIGIFFDFLDGFVARLLKVSGDLGTQLDSLADMVTSGVVPGIVMFKLIDINNSQSILSFDYHTDEMSTVSIYENTFLLIFIGFLLTLGACYRLAKFNLDTRQTDSFIGLPTPAMCLFVISLPLIQEYSEVEFAQNLISNNYFLIAITLVLTYLMNAELPLFSLKFKDASFKKNWIIYLFLLISLALILLINYLSIPIIITLYVVLSIFKNLTPKI
ncbi:phosphatidylcholine/phosphatidylserine synthase [Polaribacter sp. Hel_I_88]|uniref:CDP-alcohol phosphatidyltransferase family protein n=1 Tax=Polaribacter sp. Hel_I_88 TaxID=1250006 RepID=UPI0012DEFB66|nr:CDP-alcohol phosphatidyltransferase family protein [Polaribacter sp. Hel_I_88]